MEEEILFHPSVTQVVLHHLHLHIIEVEFLSEEAQVAAIARNDLVANLTYCSTRNTRTQKTTQRGSRTRLLSYALRVWVVG
jgi:hypothetical protein